MSQCTFKPTITRSNSHSASRVCAQKRSIKGYQKAVERMKSGYQKQKELAECREFRVWRKRPDP